MRIKLSIIVPVYNVEKYLVKCIQSILDQTFKDFELILVNDGSIDNSGIICDEYAGKDNRIKVLHDSNCGLSAARNRGIITAKGDYYAFVDSDDWIEPDMMSLLYEASIKSNADMAIIGIVEVNEYGDYLNQYIPSDDITLSEILKRSYAWNKIYKRELFDENNLFFTQGRYYEDVDLIPKLFVKSSIVVPIRAVGYNYFKRTGSITNSRDIKILDNLLAYCELKKYLVNENIFEDYKEEFEKGVEYFKKYYVNILYDYPTSLLIKNLPKMYRSFSNIGGFKIINYQRLLLKHLNFSFRKLAYIIKLKYRKKV